jgi:DNA-directed RNA polymerase specialized sigma24 family protein
VAALRTVYDRHAALAYGLALRLTGGEPERAETVVESAFLELWRAPTTNAGTQSVRSRVIALVVGAAVARSAA